LVLIFLELHLYALINLLKADKLIHSAVGYVFVAVLFFDAFVAIFRNFFLACSEHQENKSGHVTYILPFLLRVEEDSLF
jgi:Ni,Fe-hydrogenase I cytochrome b subunit